MDFDINQDYTEQDLRYIKEYILYEVEMLPDIERKQEYSLICDLEELTYEQCIERIRKINNLKPMNHVMYNSGVSSQSMKMLRMSVCYKLHQENS